MTALIVGSVICMPTLALASLTIINNSNQDSTSKINGLCTNMIGDSGITHKHASNVVSDVAISLICGANPENCVAQVYATPDCSKAAIGEMNFSQTKGIKTVTLSDAGKKANYRFIAEQFKITLNGGPA